MQRAWRPGRRTGCVAGLAGSWRGGGAAAADAAVARVAGAVGERGEWARVLTAR